MPVSLPGAVKYLDIVGVLALSAPHKLVLSGVADLDLAVVNAAYKAAGSYDFEWFDCGSGKIAATGSFSAKDGARSFKPPFAGEAVLYVRRSGTS